MEVPTVKTHVDGTTRDARRRFKKVSKVLSCLLFYLILHLTLSLFVLYITVEDARRRNNPRRTKTVQQDARRRNKPETHEDGSKR